MCRLPLDSQAYSAWPASQLDSRRLWCLAAKNNTLLPRHAWRRGKEGVRRDRCLRATTNSCCESFPLNEGLSSRRPGPCPEQGSSRCPPAGREPAAYGRCRHSAPWFNSEFGASGTRSRMI